jgi:hypothetical protein
MFYICNCSRLDFSQNRRVIRFALWGRFFFFFFEPETTKTKVDTIHGNIAQNARRNAAIEQTKTVKNNRKTAE